jgi:hypothetical protein
VGWRPTGGTLTLEKKIRIDQDKFFKIFKKIKLSLQVRTKKRRENRKNEAVHGEKST